MSNDTFSEGPEDGVYEAVLKVITVETSKRTGNDYRSWRFATPEGDTFRGISSVELTPSSKGVRWAKAILGRAPAPRESIEVLYGVPCLIEVTTNPDNGYQGVENVHPKVTPRNRPAPAPAAPPPAAGAPEPPNDFSAVDESEIPF